MHESALYNLEGRSPWSLRKVTITAKIMRLFRDVKKTTGWVTVIALIAGIVYYLELPWIVFPAFLFVTFLCSGGRSFPRVFFSTIRRDASLLTSLIITILKCRYHNYKNHIIPDLFQFTVAKYPNKTAFVFEGKSWTFKEADEYTNRVANYFKSQGFVKGDVVTIFLENRPEYVFLWLGLAKIGVISALINFNLRLDSLLHCITVAKSKALIFSGDYSDPVKEIQDKLPEQMQLYRLGTNGNCTVSAIGLNQHLKDSCTKQPTISHEKKFTDVLIYIYTSGTTGLPKAAVIRNSRFCMAGGLAPLFNISSDDIVYCTLPLYHSAAGMLCVGYCIFYGATLVIRRKFSASRFWNECIEHKATVIQYIGELCRYLLVQPPRPSDTQHSVRLAIGNGLRAKLWPEFQSRFQIKQIGEFYASTEGNANVINTDNTVGACGFTSRICPWAYPVKLIRIDRESGHILRGLDGLAIDCKPGEPGQIVSRIIKGDAVLRFDGYLNQAETSKKIARSIFRKNDVAFLSGDVVIQDEDGYIYFQDRTGDTFRWRGENVSTTEVESIVTKIVGLRDVVVYGVEVPGVEGKAGMAAIADPGNSLDISGLARSFQRVLPSYAQPVFVRVMHVVEMTGTFKFQKNKLKKEGFDISLIEDQLYFLDSKTGSYVELDGDIHEQIINGQIRL